MLVIKNKSYEIVWGSGKFSYLPVENSGAAQRALQVSKAAGVSPVVLLRQTHSTEGFVVEGFLEEFFDRTGDFVITSTPGLTIGVLTADCIPIVLLGTGNAGTQKTVAGVVHAGWRGLMNGVIEKALCVFMQEYQIAAKDIRVLIGPSIGPCCYTVREDFCTAVKNSKNARYGTQIIEYHGKVIRANLVQGAGAIVQDCGIVPNNIDISSWVCTCCSPQFCSYRRNGKDAERNFSGVRLFTSDE
mgnify:CR=1 FL=1